MIIIIILNKINKGQEIILAMTGTKPAKANNKLSNKIAGNNGNTKKLASGAIIEKIPK